MDRQKNLRLKPIWGDPLDSLVLLLRVKKRVEIWVMIESLDLKRREVISKQM